MARGEVTRGRPSWLDMRPGDFSDDAPPGALFEMTPDTMPAPDDGHGTGDLLALLD